MDIGGHVPPLLEVERRTTLAPRSGDA